MESKGETDGKRGVRGSSGLQLWTVVMDFVAVKKSQRNVGVYMEIRALVRISKRLSENFFNCK